MHKPYWIVEDCPVCGEKDEVGKWKGARMISSRWGHNVACCSDACGQAYANLPARFEMEIELAEWQISNLRNQIAGLRSKLLQAKQAERVGKRAPRL